MTLASREDMEIASLEMQLMEARAEIERLSKLQDATAARAELAQIDNERLQAEFEGYARQLAWAATDNARLRALLQKLRWKSIDKDNMEFRCDISCYEMDEIRAALEPKP